MTSLRETILSFFKMNIPLIVMHLIVTLIIVIFFYIFLYGSLNKWLFRRSQYIKNVKSETEELKNQMNLSKLKQEKEFVFSKEKLKNFESKFLLEISKKKQNELLKLDNYRKELIDQAKIDADNFKKNAVDETKQAIIKNSILLTKKIIEKEINKEIHKKMIDEFIKGLNEE